MMKPHVVIWMTHQKVRIRVARSASRGLSDTRSPIVLHHILHNLDFKAFNSYFNEINLQRLEGHLTKLHSRLRCVTSRDE